MRHVRVICYLRRIQSRNALSALAALVMAVAVSADATLAVAAGDASYENPPATIEVRIWQDLQNARSIHVSARQVGGSWDSLGIIRLALDDGLSSTGMFGYGDIALDVPLQDWASPATIEVRVWQHLLDQRNMYISARGSRGSWAALGTILLPLDHGVHRGLGYRYGDISIDAPQPPGGVVSLAGRARVRGYREGHGEEARFGRHDEATIGLAVDDDGSVVVADFRNAAIRRISPDGIVTTIAGGNGRGLLDGPGEVARFEAPDDVAIDYEGAIYVADSRAHRIRKITPDGVVTTVAGTDQPRPERWIHRDGRAGGALFIAPSGIAIDPNGDIYITEQTRIQTSLAFGLGHDVRRCGSPRVSRWAARPRPNSRTFEPWTWMRRAASICWTQSATCPAGTGLTTQSERSTRAVGSQPSTWTAPHSRAGCSWLRQGSR